MPISLFQGKSERIRGGMPGNSGSLHYDMLIYIDDLAVAARPG